MPVLERISSGFTERTTVQKPSGITPSWSTKTFMRRMVQVPVIVLESVVRAMKAKPEALPELPVQTPNNPWLSFSGSSPSSVCWRSPCPFVKNEWRRTPTRRNPTLRLSDSAFNERALCIVHSLDQMPAEQGVNSLCSWLLLSSLFMHVLIDSLDLFPHQRIGSSKGRP